MGGAERDSFYDDGDVFDRYDKHRSGDPQLSPNYVMEEPAVLAEVGDPSGLRVLDLGCGDGAFGRHLLDAGAQSYEGVDSSRRMIDAARHNLAGTGASVRLADIAELRPDRNAYDLITARLCLHYVADVAHVVARAGEALAPGGRLVVTVVHPVITSHDNRPSGPRTTWTVDGYFDTGPREREWLGSTVTWYHRTVEDYVGAVTAAGLTLLALRECAPDARRLGGRAEELHRRRRVPLFLLLTARRGSE